MGSGGIQALYEWRESLALPPIRKIRCMVKQIFDHGSRVYSLTLVPEKEIPKFRPGQFLHLALDEYEPYGFWPDSRAFSIAGCPDNCNHITISYSVIGKFTTRMEKELFEGKMVWIKLPYGDFIIDNNGEAILIAGGTGITAFSAYLEALKPEIDHDVYLFYGARSENLLIYKEMLSKIARSVPGFHLQYFIERVKEPSSIYGFTPLIGKLDIHRIWQIIEEPRSAIYYLSGPPAMLKQFSTDLDLLGISKRQIRIDAWE